jgi:hypothetical protein
MAAASAAGSATSRWLVAAGGGGDAAAQPAADDNAPVPGAPGAAAAGGPPTVCGALAASASARSRASRSAVPSRMKQELDELRGQLGAVQTQGLAAQAALLKLEQEVRGTACGLGHGFACRLVRLETLAVMVRTPGQLPPACPSRRPDGSAAQGAGGSGRAPCRHSCGPPGGSRQRLGDAGCAIRGAAAGPDAAARRVAGRL